MSDTLKWHDWTGGVRDIASGVPVAVRWRNGNEWQGDAADFQWQWRPEPQVHDIVAYAYLDLETWEDDGSLRATHGSFDAGAMQKAMEAALPRTKAQADGMMLALNAWDYKTGTVRNAFPTAEDLERYRNSMTPEARAESDKLWAELIIPAFRKWG